MIRAKDAPSGCIIYLMLSIVINLFILILRISAHEVQNNTTVAEAVAATPTTLAATIYHTDVTTTTNIATTATTTIANDIKTKSDDIHESAMTSTTDTITTKTTLHSNPDRQRSVRMDQGEAFNEHSTTVVVLPIAARLVKNEYDAVYKDDNIANELDEDSGKTMDFTNDETVATVIPVLPNATNNHLNETRITYDIGAVTLQTNMQRNATISRDQLNLLGVIKSSSSSSSAMANNNATNQKQHKPDSPMLNYIFDAHLTNKHRHYDPRYGPHFDDVHVAEKVGNVTAQLGSVAYLNCRIRLLQDKTVTWLKREQNNSHIQLLTIGVHTYTFDKRFSVEFEYPNNWRLRIADTNKSDEGLYECQISTHPPRAIRTQFNVKSPEVFIVDEFEQPLADKYYEVDSTIELTCIVRHVSMLSKTVQWLHGKQMLNYDMTRGGISVKTDLMENGANSTLSIAKVRKTDGGNYTCSISSNDYHTINIQVINGESLAELYHGSAVCSQHKLTIHNRIGIFVSTIIVLSRYINISDAFKVMTIDERRFIK